MTTHLPDLDSTTPPTTLYAKTACGAFRLRDQITGGRPSCVDCQIALIARIDRQRRHSWVGQ